MKIVQTALIIFVVGLLCYSQLQAKSPFVVSEQAKQLAKNSIIVDGHIDVPYRVYDEWVDVSKATEGGDFDYPRAILGGLNAPFMSIYVPSSLDGTAKSTQTAHRLIDLVEAIVARAPDKFAIASSVKDVREQFKQGLISLPLGIENGAPINGDLNNLSVFYQRGVRYITLTHAKSNEISDSSYDENKQWGGLSPFGKKVVQEMNRLGIMVDISHVSDAAFFDAIQVSSVPMIASHSSLRHYTPGFERNMSDEMLLALAKNGGVIMINFGSSFLTQVSIDWYAAQSAAIKKMEAKYGKDSPQVQQFKQDYRKNHPFPFANIDDVVQHIDHAVKLVGIDHVGLGSDYDGVGDSLPIGLKDVSTFPALVQALLNKGYSEQDIKKILGENVLRVWQQVEAHAKQ